MMRTILYLVAVLMIATSIYGFVDYSRPATDPALAGTFGGPGPVKKKLLAKENRGNDGNAIVKSNKNE